tara:strand:+ start:182 stop:418 length:237 start_codon:yes stop_codon:yes gene_type:complete
MTETDTQRRFGMDENEIALVVWAGTYQEDPLFDEHKAMKEMRRKLKTGSPLHAAEIHPHRVTARKIMQLLESKKQEKE